MPETEGWGVVNSSRPLNLRTGLTLIGGFFSVGSAFSTGMGIPSRRRTHVTITFLVVTHQNRNWVIMLVELGWCDDCADAVHADQASACGNIIFLI
jgi:hypothetical protein